MFADLRSLIGRMALTLGCIGTLVATSVQAQDADAGVASDAAATDVAAPSPEAPSTPAPTDTNASPADALPDAPPTNLEPGADAQTGIRGRIVDRKTGVGIEMAPVLIVERERTRSVITIENGAYELNVPPGVYTVRSFYDLYHGARLGNVRVTRGRFSEVNLLLDPVDEAEEIAVEEIEVPYRADLTTAAAQDAVRMEAGGIGDGMGAQQMSQSGASDAGSAAKRVVGVTVEGSSLMIRGLGGRYSRVYMNGVPLPSTDPDSPSVDLDLFPTNIIDSMTVTKAFLPDMPADFAGGVLDIGTVTFPREFTFDIGLSGQYASMSTFRDRLDYQGGSTDFLGFDDGTRALPDAVPAAKFIPSDYDDRGLSIARSFQNTWSRKRLMGLPNLGMDVTLGNAINFGTNSRFGYLATVAYDHQDVRTVGSSRKFPGYREDGSLASGDTRTRYPHVELGAEEVQLSAIGTTSLDIGADHSLTALTLFNRSASDETGFRRGFDDEYDVGLAIEKWQLHYTARQIWFNQLLGDHRNLAGTRLRLRWDGFLATALRDEPDRRNIDYGARSDDPRLAWRNQSAQRIFSELNGLDGGGGASLRVPLWSEGWATLGGSGRYTRREFTTRRFQLAKGRDIEADDYLRAPEDLFSEENLGSLTMLNQEYTRDTDSFRASQSVGAAYAMLETPLVGPLSITGGARFEAYVQDLVVQSPFPPSEDSEPPTATTRTDLNVLPAAALKYELTETMLLRAAYGMTVGRPQARELAPFVYFDFVRDRNISGSVDLKTTTIHNLDLRWEWFFAEAQIIAVSVFYKKFFDPIEQYLANDGSSGLYANTRAATNYGAELEFRTSLEHVAPVLRNFQIGSNLSLIRSSVQLSEEQTARTAPGARAMYGQAPYVINLSLRFADPATKASLGLVYNLVGPRLTDVGVKVSDSTTYPNVERLPIHSLDLVSEWRISEDLKLKLKWKNVLFQTDRLNQGGVIIVRKNPGTFVSIGLDYAY